MKRKDPPVGAGNRQAPKVEANKRQKVDHHRARRRDARTLTTQTSSNVLQNGALDVDKFVKAREFEIQALDRGMSRSKKVLSQRAFQQVPRDLRRRTASHNAKRVPKRLRARAKKEMLQDETPTVNSRTRKPTKHQRLRAETVKKLRALGARRKTKQEQTQVAETNKQASAERPQVENEAKPMDSSNATIRTRAPKVKKASLAKPPTPKAKFRKRQKSKSWLPTHLFHAKRAHMTPPSAPMWRFAIAMAPTQKCYRTTHRASSERGAVAWDTSYMATIGLEGQQRSICGMLRAMGMTVLDGSRTDQRWIGGTRVSHRYAYERETPHRLIAPVTIIWCVPSDDKVQPLEAEKRRRTVFLRVQPSAFLQLWEEVIRLGKVAKPSVSVEDLRFEMGSIEIIGPGSTEALTAALWPYDAVPDAAGPASTVSAVSDTSNSVEGVWKSLASVTNPSILPPGALLGFDVQDPRLHHPPRTVALPKTEDDQSRLYETMANWPVDNTQRSASLFDRLARVKASKLPSQKAINRRKRQSGAGEYPALQPSDPRIPVLLYTSPEAAQRQQGTWTLLAPWKCILPIWYSVMYYPLSTGQQPRFGGLNELRQVAFETGKPWFPADLPGTDAGWEWELQERRRRHDEWARRPKAKRVAWDRVDLGDGRKGEHGSGWCCDWQLLCDPDTSAVSALDGVDVEMSVDAEPARNDGPKSAENSTSVPAAAEAPEAATESTDSKGNAVTVGDAVPPPEIKPASLTQLVTPQAMTLLKDANTTIPSGHIAAVRLSLLSRGTPQACARIYRLPSETDARQRWLDLQPSRQPASAKRHKNALPRVPRDAPAHLVHQRLARSLLEPTRAGADNYPPCPSADELLGFVTTGNFNLADGKGTGIGCLALARVAPSVRERGMGREGRLCIVRNAGESTGRLAVWELV